MPKGIYEHKKFSKERRKKHSERAKQAWKEGGYLKKAIKKIKKCLYCNNDIIITGLRQRFCKECYKKRKKEIKKETAKKWWLLTRKLKEPRNCKKCGIKIENRPHQSRLCLICVIKEKKERKEKTIILTIARKAKTKEKREKKEKEKIIKMPKIIKRSKRTRFRVLRRDNFTCQYCGRKAPDIVVQVDHIIPESKGGDYSDNNLVTACWECNIGKSNILF